MVAMMGERAFRGVKAKRVPVRRGLELLLLKAAQRATAKAAPIDAARLDLDGTRWRPRITDDDA